MFKSFEVLRRLDAFVTGSLSGLCLFYRNFDSENEQYPVTNSQLNPGRSLRIILSVFFRQFVNFKFKFIAALLIITGLSGCGSHVHHFVEPGETLYSISWAYGHDYRDVARWNDIPPPFIVKKGQRLRVVPPGRPDRAPKKASKNRETAVSKAAGKGQNNKADSRSPGKLAPVVTPSGASKSLSWRWPVRGGEIIQTFDIHNPAKQGVDVKGKIGQPVYAAEAGRVVYSGGGLKHYGKLIIVKHNETYLSAYAHNKRLLVKEGDVLKSGQRIAEMGSTGTNTTKLHFEIRRNGKPVNPLSYLPRR